MTVRYQSDLHLHWAAYPRRQLVTLFPARRNWRFPSSIPHVWVVVWFFQLASSSLLDLAFTVSKYYGKGGFVWIHPPATGTGLGLAFTRWL